uniref:Uncharacterized protein n=1 Tax=viral metagenome TaxID=1070528 RepID=A0A6M3KWY4_9ZZZZ
MVSHDIRFKSPVPFGNRTEFGFMLDDPKNKKPWRVQSKDFLPPSFVTGEASYDNIRPDEIGPLFIADSWRRGFGSKDFIENERYLTGVDTDSRFRGRIMLSPLQSAAISLPASTTTTVIIANGTLEAWNAANTIPTAWSTTLSASCEVTRTTTKHGGTYAARLEGDDNGSAYLIYTFPFDTAMRGKSVTVTFWGYKNADLDTFSGYVYDGEDTTTTTVTATSYDSAKTIAHTFNANADRFVLTFRAYESGTDPYYAYVDDVTVTRSDTPYGTCSDALLFGSTIVAAFGSTLVKSTDGATFTVVGDFCATITALKVFGDNLVIALGNSNAAYYTSNLTTFTKLSTYSGSTVTTVTTAAYDGDDVAIDVVATTGFVATNYILWEDEICLVNGITDGNTFDLTGGRGALGSAASGHASGTTIRLLGAEGECKYLSIAGGSQLWASTGDNTMVVTDDLVNTPFSTAYTVGRTGFDITGLVDNPEGTVFASLQDQVYYLSGADVLPVASETASHQSTSNDYPIYLWKNILFMPRGTNKLYAYNVESYEIEDISPAQRSPTDGDYDGKVLCMAFDSDWAYCATENSTKVQILAGRYEVVGSLQWVWHTLYEETTNDYTCMWVSNISGSNVLYAATATLADGIDRFALPSSYSDNLIEGISFQTEGTHTEPFIVTQFSENDKLWSGVYVSSINFSGVTSIGVYYQLDTGSDWTLLGMCEADTYDWTSTPKVWPTEKATYFPIGKVSRKIRLQFRLKGKLDGATTTLTPIVTRYRVDGKVENSLDGTSLDKAMITCSIKCHGEQPSYGAPMQRTVGGELAALWWLKRLGVPVTLYGYDGIERQVKFRSLYHEADGEATDRTFVATAVLEEV